MRDCRDLVADTHVWSIVIIKVNIPTDDITGMDDVLEMPLAVNTLHFYNTVGSLGYGVICWVVILGHADGYAVGL